MNYEDKKKYLNNFITLDAHIDALLTEKEKWYNRALDLENTYQRISLKSTNKDVNVTIEKVISLERQIDNEIDRLVDMRKTISTAIDNIDDMILQKILYLKYINGKSFENIGEEIGYCTKQISRLHKRAIEIIEI